MSNKEKKTTEAESIQVAEKEEATTKTSNSQKGKKQNGSNALKSVGLAACKRHRLSEVWVTSDGQTFPKENDAKNHARNLVNNEIIKVTAQ